MRTELLASSQSYGSIDTDAWCKRALMKHLCVCIVATDFGRLLPLLEKDQRFDATNYFNPADLEIVMNVSVQDIDHTQPNTSISHNRTPRSHITEHIDHTQPNTSISHNRTHRSHTTEHINQHSYPNTLKKTQPNTSISILAETQLCTH